MDERKVVFLEINQDDRHFSYLASIEEAMTQANQQVEMLQETIDSIATLKPQCDKLDYILSACSGALCGTIDIFFVGKPKDSTIGDLTDKGFGNLICLFAKRQGWEGSENEGDSVKLAIEFLENKFNVPYEQTHPGKAGRDYLNLTPSNHHFKSLSHNPSVLGLFFSILDQFCNTSHFVSGGRLIILQDAKPGFKLQGNTLSSRIWCGIVNWFGHLVSDVGGCKKSNGRGMGIPSPLWTWVNDIIAIKAELGIPVSQFNDDVNELALKMYKKGFDFRFQTAQCIPVFINELIVRLFYSVRRLLAYYKNTAKENRSIQQLWATCKPFSNPTVKRMLTIAHGVFCAMDAGDAAIRAFAAGGGHFNALEFCMRLNVAGVGRFTICLYGEAKLAYRLYAAEKDAKFASKQKQLTEYYIEGLLQLREIYDDADYLNFVDDLKNNNYVLAFEKTAALAQKRGVPNSQVLQSKNDIDNYFTRK